jgi:Fe2+ or Zn2+ uptake regulation protein
MTGDPKHWQQKLEAQGYRLTSSRRAIIEFLCQTDQPINPSDTYELIHQAHPRIGRMTVYRTMEQLAHLGLIRRLHEGCHSYIACPDGDWALLICEQCGSQEYLQAEKFIAFVEKGQSFKVSTPLLQFFGYCQRCQNLA